MISIWAFLILLAIFGKISHYCAEHQAGYCQDLVNRHLPKGFLFILTLLAYQSFKRRQHKTVMAPSKEYSDFAKSPEKYDNHIIRIRAKIVKTLKDSAKEVIVRKSIDTYRTIVGDDDRTGRYLHQRFIINSPALLENETIIVYHNVKFGKEKLKKGKWFEIEGVYIHKESNSKRKRKYGLIHYTHEPLGSITRLKRKPREEVASSIKVSTRS